jgi:two-component system chemotaxis response regulator CheB
LTAIRVAVADDSTFMRQAVARMLADQEGIVLAGLASSGEELLDHLERWRPDVIILDLSMPGIGGLATLDAVMARRPTPVLILSTHSRKDAPPTIEALHRGAADFIDKQQYSLVDFERLRAALLDKIRQLALPPGGGAAARAAAANGRPAAGRDREARSFAAGESGAMAPAVHGDVEAAAALDAGVGGGEAGGGSAPVPAVERGAPELLLLGASTGGPPAIEAILRELSAGVSGAAGAGAAAGTSGGSGAAADARLPVPVVVVQHMPAGFTRSFADRLNACLALPVREAAHEELLAPGTVYVAPGGVHIRVARRRDGLHALLSAAPAGAAHRPSIDLLFASAAAVAGGRVVAAVLTGMGYDGAAGLAALARAGAHTLAQDEATSIVYGMPRAAVAAGGVREVLPLGRIGGRLRELLAADDAGAPGAG